MGAGKTTIGVLLAAQLDRQYLDSDDLLTNSQGRTAARIAAEDGITALHAIEAQVTREALTRQDPAVIAAAASVVENEEVRAALAKHTCLWLDADAATLAARHERANHRRSLDEPSATFSEMKRRRDPVYSELALARIDTATTRPEEALANALATLKSRARPA